MRKLHFARVLAFLVVSLLLPCNALAEDNASAGNVYYYDTVQETKLDRGYTQESRIDEGDPHYGWKIGKFAVSGFTSRTQDEVPTFLKNVGDQVKLSFVLTQNIDSLNGNPDVVIWADKNGFDEYFGIPKTDFGRGMLIIKQTNYQNDSGEPVKYANYLYGLDVGAETEVDLFEEGDYEAALDYEIKCPGFMGIIPEYHNYRMYFKFKVRNGNTMMYLFDAETGEELLGGTATPNGFRIDMAQSHYLEVSVKKEILNETRNGLVEDTRFNQTATDGSTYTDPGIYTITTRNPTTNEEPTRKVIYVGDDDLLKASVHNNMSVTDVQAYLDEGATVDDAGNIIQASVAVDSGEGATDVGDDGAIEPAVSEGDKPAFAVRPAFLVLLVAALVFAIARTLRGGVSSEEDAA